MPEAGFNPHQGWHPGVDYPYNDFFGYGYGWPVAGDVPFAAPAGQGWFDISTLLASPFPGMAWNPHGVMEPHMQQYPPPYHGLHQGPSMAYHGEANNGGIPGLNFHNSQGGVGNEPGYDYLFPAEHCKIHVLLSDTPPWMNAGPYKQRCFNVPTGISVKELMQQFGCTNKDPAKNKLYELTQGGDGKWYKGIVVSGDQKEKVAKKIEAIGWNKDRNGVKKDFVWLYFTKD